MRHLCILCIKVSGKFYAKPVCFLWFGKWHEEYDKFSPEHLKVSKLGFWWDPLIQISKSMSLKSTEELSVITMKNDAIFEKELTCHFKVDMRNLMNFDLSTWKSLNRLLLSTVYIVWAKKSTEELSFMKLKRDTKFEEESTFHFKIDIRNLTNFDVSTWKSQNFSL